MSTCPARGPEQLDTVKQLELGCQLGALPDRPLGVEFGRQCRTADYVWGDAAAAQGDL